MTVPQEEVWACAFMESVQPGVEVSINDDNSSDSMFDLLLQREGQSVGAVEVTAAATEDQIELWQVANGSEEQMVLPTLEGGWFVTLKPSCRFKRMLPGLEKLLSDCEAIGVGSVGNGEMPTKFDSDLADLGICRVQRIGTSTRGSVSFTIGLDLEDSTGWVSAAETHVVDWITEWIEDPSQEHNIKKLVASGLPERHLFVFVLPFSPAPFQVLYFLDQKGGDLPPQELILPDGLTHLWLSNSSPTGGRVVRWDPEQGWESFLKPEFLEIDSEI